MDKRAILQGIIDLGGNCEGLWVPNGHYRLCDDCPMAKLKQRPDGTYYGCYDSLITMTEESDDDVNRVYREKAIELLQDIIVEDMLLGDLSAPSS